MDTHNAELTQRLLTYAEVNKRYNLPLGTLYCLVRQGRIPHVRLGKRLVRFSGEAIEHWLADNTVGASAPVHRGS